MTQSPDLPHWSNGTFLRSILLYLPWGMFLWQLGVMFVLPVAVLVIEVLCYLVWKKSETGHDTFGRNLLGYASVGDIIWLGSAIAVAGLSGQMPLWGFGAIIVIWLGYVMFQYLASRVVPLPKPGSKTKVSPGDIKLPAGPLRTLQKPLEIWLAFTLIGIGFASCAVLYFMGERYGILVGLSVAFLGISCGFSPQLRGVFVARRMKTSQR